MDGDGDGEVWGWAGLGMGWCVDIIALTAILFEGVTG